jgi:hypothetical protein
LQLNLAAIRGMRVVVFFAFCFCYFVADSVCGAWLSEVEGAGMAEGALWITRPSADEGFDPDDPKLLEPLPPPAAAEDDDHRPRANGGKQEEAEGES